MVIKLIFAHKVSAVRLGIVGEKGIRCESVTIPVAVCALFYSQTKVGHWETEKAE